MPCRHHAERHAKRSGDDGSKTRVQSCPSKVGLAPRTVIAEPLLRRRVWGREETVRFWACSEDSCRSASDPISGRCTFLGASRKLPLLAFQYWRGRGR
jgi:hypothetical protein